MRENRLYLHNVNYSGKYSNSALVRLEPTVGKVDGKTPSLFVFSAVRESLSVLAEIVQKREIKGYSNDPDWHLAHPGREGLGSMFCTVMEA
jgi:hypothetical protein